MLKLALIFLIAGLVLGALGFGGIGGAFVGIAKILFFIAIALFVIFLILAFLGGKKVKDTIG
ncbi:DUF1328 family protein [Pacificimonas flava]|uniref:UPF0391 membrane protein C725_0022 n=1 Tax=Pacificimonas flava TaxID=1234595 RepID=M2U7X9_9SPHN|nr:DUF1328 family protein [Pacificimonas flava]EMD84092.1 hypothetical protein C725_0022 [Pacificimonas flava]MBB5280031.1 uncharacterized membrane protein YtjA (UPF0391 family) [Pacificimonas flava]